MGEVLYVTWLPLDGDESPKETIARMLRDNKRLTSEIEQLRGRLRDEGLVYVLERDGLVKVGTTRKLVRRLADLRKSGEFRLLSLELGGYGRERVLLQRFAHLADAPGSEWHHDDGSLAEYAASVEFLPPEGKWAAKAYLRCGYSAVPATRPRRDTHRPGTDDGEWS